MEKRETINEYQNLIKKLNQHKLEYMQKENRRHYQDANCSECGDKGYKALPEYITLFGVEQIEIRLYYCSCEVGQKIKKGADTK